jgi:lysyl-tRNA synthetase class 2
VSAVRLQKPPGPALVLTAPAFRRHTRWTVRLLTLLVAGAGLLDLVSASSAELVNRVETLDRYVPAVIPATAGPLTNVTGAGLLLLVPALLRRKRRAMLLAVALLLLSSVLNLAKGFDWEEATATTTVALLLITNGRHFRALGDPATRPRLVAAAIGVVLAVYGYGTTVLLFHGHTGSVPFAVSDVTRELLAVRPSPHDLDPWFAWSVRLLALVGIFQVLRLALRPWREEQAAVERDRERASALIGRYGRDTLSYFALRRDKRYFFGPDGEAFLAYRLVAGMALVSGDPVGAARSVPACFEAFLAYAHERAWPVSVLGVAEERLALYESLGLRSRYEGDEAIVEPGAFSLDGRSVRKVRQSVHRLERLGYHVLVRRADEVGPGLRRAMEGIAELWREGKPETGFSMEMDRLFRAEGEADRSVFAIAVDQDGIPQGFLHFVPAPAGRALSLSSMRRYRDTPNGLNEFLVCKTLAWAAENGIERVSLNFAAFAGLLGDPDGLGRVERAQRAVLLRLQGRFQLTRLLDFNRKFAPAFTRRYVVYESHGSLPRLAVAAMLAEGYVRPPRLAPLRWRR